MLLDWVAFAQLEPRCTWSSQLWAVLETGRAVSSFTPADITVVELRPHCGFEQFWPRIRAKRTALGADELPALGEVSGDGSSSDDQDSDNSATAGGSDGNSDAGTASDQVFPPILNVASICYMLQAHAIDGLLVTKP